MSVVGEEGCSGVAVASANMVEMGSPLADCEAPHEGCNCERVFTWAGTCDGKMSQDVIMQNELCEGSARVPLKWARGEVYFLVIFELWITNLSVKV